MGHDPQAPTSTQARGSSSEIDAVSLGRNVQFLSGPGLGGGQGLFLSRARQDAGSERPLGWARFLSYCTQGEGPCLGIQSRAIRRLTAYLHKDTV